MTDTCKAESFFNYFSKEKTPNTAFLVSSRPYANSHSSGWSGKLNVYVADQFTQYLWKYLNRINEHGYFKRFFRETLQTISDHFYKESPAKPGWGIFFENKTLDDIMVHEFLPPPPESPFDIKDEPMDRV